MVPFLPPQPEGGGRWDDFWLTWAEVASSPRSQAASCWKVRSVSQSLDSFTKTGHWPVVSLFSAALQPLPIRHRRGCCPKLCPVAVQLTGPSHRAIASNGPCCKSGGGGGGGGNK